MNQQEEFELLRKKNRRRFIGTMFLIIIVSLVLVIIFIIQDNKKQRILNEKSSPDINWQFKSTDKLANSINSEEINNYIADKKNQNNNLNSYFTYFDSLAYKVIENSQLYSFFKNAYNLESNKKIIKNFNKLKNNKNENISLQKTKNIAAKNTENLNINESIASDDLLQEKKSPRKLTSSEILTGKVNDNVKLDNIKSNTLSNVQKEKSLPRRLTPSEILAGKVKDNTSNKKIDVKKFIIQTGAFVNKTQALSQIKNLENNGIKANLLIVNTAKGELNRVRVGPFKSKLQAQKILNKIKSVNIDGIIVVQ